MSDADDPLVAHCRRSIARGSTSFDAASRLFEPRLRRDVWLLYAWCRHCDDLVDQQDHGGEPTAADHPEREARFAALRIATEAALAGEPVEEPALRALQRVARAHRIDARWARDLLDGLAMDLEDRRFASVDDTLAYCWGVAGVVGVMMASMMGVRDPAVLRRAQDLGLAFQLTNICRDVLEDARAGRVYLPENLLARHGIAATPAAVADPANAAGVHAVTRELLERAECFYTSSRVGLRDLPWRSALAVAAARDVYREIGRRVRRDGSAALSRRTRVPRVVLPWLLLRGALVATWSRAERRAPRPARPMLWTRI